MIRDQILVATAATTGRQRRNNETFLSRIVYDLLKLAKTRNFWRCRAFSPFLFPFIIWNDRALPIKISHSLASLFLSALFWCVDCIWFRRYIQCRKCYKFFHRYFRLTKMVRERTKWNETNTKRHQQQIEPSQTMCGK